MTENKHKQMNASTQQSLKDALVDLMEEKGFSNVSVSSLSQKAGVNRGTFYLHYQDKYDLMDQAQEELLIGLREKMRLLNPLEAMGYISNEIPYPPMVGVFRYLQENKRFLKLLIGPTGDPAFPKKIKAIMKEGVQDILAEKMLIETNSTMPYQFFTVFHTSAFFGIIEEWLENDMPQSPEELALIFIRIFNFIKVNLLRISN